MNLFLTLCLCVPPQAPSQDPAPPAARPEPMPIPTTVILGRGDHHIAIDGSLQDWPDLPSIRLVDARQLSGSAMGAFRGRGDIAGRVFMLWDDEALYVAAAVQDDWHVRLTEDSPRLDEIPPADSVMITIDPRRDTRSIGRDEGRQEDTEFWLADVEGQGQQVVLWDRFRGTARFVRGGSAAAMRDEDQRITYYEARLPWAEILPHGEKPAAGRVIDLQIVLNDYDEPTDPMPQTRVGWTFGMGTRIDPGLLGSALLLAETPDRLPAQIDLPAMPPPAEPDEPPVPDQRYWVQFLERLLKTAPTAVDAATVDPFFAGGKDRRAVLDELERHVSVFPRVDFLEFQQRIHRRMNRECAGIVATGLPYFWESALDELQRRAAEPPPDRGFRLFRLPQGGWLVRSRIANFAIDPAGYRIEKSIWGAIDFVLLTQPLDISKRNDQLLLRMRAAKPERPFLTHVALHLPGIPAGEIPLVVPGVTYTQKGLRITVLGRIEDSGLVSREVGYQITWPDGSVLVVTGPTLRDEDASITGPVDVALLSALHPQARELGRRIAARMTVLDDVLQCATYPGAWGRVTLDSSRELQADLAPSPSIILAPAESVDSHPAARAR